MTYSIKIQNTIKVMQDFVRNNVRIYRSDPKAFTRKGKLGFAQYIYLGLTLLKNSLRVELHNNLFFNELEVVSASAFTQARYKIRESFYKDWNAVLRQEIYLKQEEEPSGYSLKKYRSYYIDAFDGTKLVLPYRKDLADHFGVQQGGSKKKVTKTVMAGTFLHADILNNYVLDSHIHNLSTGERTVCRHQGHTFRSDAITLLDRGLGSAGLFAYLIREKKYFICRLKKGFNNAVKAFEATDLQDDILKFKVKDSAYFPNSAGKLTIKIKCKQKVQVRVVKVVLKTGEIELLATSLPDCFTIQDLEELYGLRWGIETIIDSLKNQLMLMCFSGLKKEAIYQDIYATMVVYNLRQLIINETQVVIDKKKPQKSIQKHTQKVNKNVAIGVLKPFIMRLFVQEDTTNIIEHIIQYLQRTTISDVKDKIHPKRYKGLARRRNLKTQTNYKRAL